MSEKIKNPVDAAAENGDGEVPGTELLSQRPDLLGVHDVDIPGLSVRGTIVEVHKNELLVQDPADPIDPTSVVLRYTDPEGYERVTSRLLSEIPLQPTGLPDTEELLHCPDKIDQLVTNSELMIGQGGHEGQGSGEIHYAIYELKRRVLLEIVAPAVLAHKFDKAVGTLAASAEDAVGSVELGIEAGLGALDKIKEGSEQLLQGDIAAVKRVLGRLNDIVSNKGATTDEIVHNARELNSFAESYGDFRNKLEQTLTKSPERSLRTNADSLDELADNGRSTLKDMNELRGGAESAPEVLYNDTRDEISTAIAEIGAATTAEHQTTCDEISTKAEDRVLQIKLKSEELYTDLSAAIVGFPDEGMLLKLPGVIALGDSVAELVRVAGREDVSTRSLRLHLDNLRQMVMQIEGVATDIRGDAVKTQVRLQTISSKAQELKQ